MKFRVSVVKLLLGDDLRDSYLHRTISTFWFPTAVFATLLLYSFTQLNFFPVPWPDGSAFYLPSLDLLKWPPEWKMHSQAAFVESYDTANFNMMPLLPFILGLFTRLPFFSSLPLPQAIKIVNLLSLGAWSLLLWAWAFRDRKRTASRTDSQLPMALLLLCALWDPSIRWGTLVVRSEPWIGLLWLAILMILERMQARENTPKTEEKKTWQLALLLALGAYTHFEAIVLVPATAAGLYSSKTQTWARRLFQVGWKTSVFLIPWGVYILSHFPLFLDQMATQFGRLGHGNFWVSSPYLAFHSLFMELGSPVGAPKFFNLAKGTFWLLAIAGSLRALFFRRFSVKPVEISGLLFFWSCFYLWCTKPEMWFTTLVHMALWPWAALILKSILAQEATPKVIGQRNTLGSWVRPLWLTLPLGLFSALSFFAQGKMLQTVSGGYDWATYQKWMDCIEITVNERITGGRAPKLWQPHVPDVLVELSRRQPTWDLTRTLDFENLKTVAVQKITSFDAILLTRAFDPPKNDPVPKYAGPERQSDAQLLTSEMDQPFGALLLQEYSSPTHPFFDRRVCHYGPFFAMVLRRN